MTDHTEAPSLTARVPRDARRLAAASIALAVAFNASIVLPYFVGHRHFWVMTAVVVAVSVGIGVAIGRWSYRHRLARQLFPAPPAGDPLIGLAAPLLPAGSYAFDRERGEYTLTSLELSTERAPLQLHHHDSRITAPGSIRLLRDAADPWRTVRADTAEGPIARARWMQSAQVATRIRVWMIDTADGPLELRGTGVRTFGLFDADRCLVTFVSRWGPSCAMTIHESVPAWLLLFAAHCLFLEAPW